MDKMSTLAEDQSLEKYDHPRCSWHILFGTRTELDNLHHARTANDFKDAWTALVNEYGLQEENAYLQKEMDIDICKDVKMEVDPPKL
ncbi:Os06g0245050 [Oryza sativa Japonica Group]|uniref:Os06g0245050 protein n=1 Tax=Oryza sativa subsp. japonica TaxID=39947 RepID=A0A0P0WV14_ORYSJ|nr:Os06g0245050 [Oryza sativa Japonica Group]